MSKRKTEKLGIEKLPLEELKAERGFVDFDSAMKGIINVGGNRISTFNEFVEFCHRNFPEQSNNTIITTWEKLQCLPIGTKIRLPQNVHFNGYLEICILVF